MIEAQLPDKLVDEKLRGISKQYCLQSQCAKQRKLHSTHNMERFVPSQ